MGRTALIYAAWYGHVAVVELLLQESADVSICDEVCSTVSSETVIGSELKCHCPTCGDHMPHIIQCLM